MNQQRYQQKNQWWRFWHQWSPLSPRGCCFSSCWRSISSRTRRISSWRSSRSMGGLSLWKGNSSKSLLQQEWDFIPFTNYNLKLPSPKDVIPTLQTPSIQILLDNAARCNKFNKDDQGSPFFMLLGDGLNPVLQFKRLFSLSSKHSSGYPFFFTTFCE